MMKTIIMIKNSMKRGQQVNKNTEEVRKGKMGERTYENRKYEDNDNQETEI